MWRHRELWAEAIRNLGPVQVGVGAVCTFVLSVLGILSVGQAQSALDQASQRNLAGGLVWSVMASPENPLDGGVCEGLNQLSGVAAAGGTTVADTPEITGVAGTPKMTARGITPHTLRVWDASAPTTGLIVGSEYEQMGIVSKGSVLVTPGTQIAAPVVSRTGSFVQPDQLTSSLLLVVTGPQPLTDCWVRMAPGAISHAEELLTASFGSVPGVRIVPYKAQPENVLTPAEQWRMYSDSHPWTLAGLLMAVILAFGAWTKRGDAAIYRAFGTSRSMVAGLESISSFLVLLPATLLGVIVSLLAGALLARGPLGGELVLVVIRLLASAALLAFALAIPLKACVTGGSITKALKDR